MGVKLLMLKGLPASGKSTHAKELQAQGWVRANKDDIRAERFPHYEFKDEKTVLMIEDEYIIEGLKSGRNVVVDDTNFNQQERLQKIAKDNDAEFEVLFIDTPVEICVRRNRKRAKSVPLEAILGMYNKYIAPYRDYPPVYDDSLEETIIVDLDGTLAHATDRNPYDDVDVSGDKLDDAVSSVMEMAYGHGYKVVILTGRHEENIISTREWLKANAVNYDFLFCRKEGDDRPDFEIKGELYQEHIAGKYNVKFVMDDRPAVCRTWRRLGLKVLQVGDPHHEF